MFYNNTCIENLLRAKDEKGYLAHVHNAREIYAWFSIVLLLDVFITLPHLENWHLLSFEAGTQSQFYAKCYVFTSKASGFRHEDPRMIKVI